MQVPTPKQLLGRIYAVSGLRCSHLRFMRLLQLSAADLDISSYQSDDFDDETGTLGHTGTPTWR